MFGSGIGDALIGIGIIALGVVIAWAALHNRQSRRELRNTEAATRNLYQEQDAADKEGRS